MPLFGEIVDGAMRLNEFGKIVADKWLWLPSQYPHMKLDEWCMMPDHLHGVLVLVGTATDGVATATPVADGASPPRKTVGRLIGAFKTVTTKQVNCVRGTPGAVLWQRDFWERVVRDEVELDNVRRYIRQNAARYAAVGQTIV
jgi:REP element-mobilizing transposase RayT